MRSEEKLVLLFGRLMELLRERSDAADDLKAALRGLEEVVAEHVRFVFSRAVEESASQYQFEPIETERPLEEDVSSRIATPDSHRVP